MTEKKALIAMSGGVDSSVAAFLTARDGFTCMGATMRLYDVQEAVCGSSDAVEDARSVATKLGMPFYVFHLTDEFTRIVIDNFTQCYEAGLTPNPCIQCNRHMKFSRFLEEALALGCDKRLARRFGAHRLSACPYIRVSNSQGLTAKQWSQLMRQILETMATRQKKRPLENLNYVLDNYMR